MRHTFQTKIYHYSHHLQAMWLTNPASKASDDLLPLSSITAHNATTQLIVALDAHRCHILWTCDAMGLVYLVLLMGEGVSR